MALFPIFSHSLFRLFCLILTGLLAVASLAACSSETEPAPVSSGPAASATTQAVASGPQPVPEPMPPATPSAIIQMPGPTLAPMPTPIVIMPSPTRASPATPVNGPATATKAGQPADTGASNSSDGPTLQIGSGDTWGDVYNSLSDEEQSCIRNELGEEQLAELLDTPSFLDGSMTAYSRMVLPCISEDAARELLLATLEAAGDEFNEEEEGCLRELLGNFNPVDLANASVPEPTQEQELMMISFLLGVVGCLPELAGEFAGGPTNGNSLGGKPIVQDPALLWSFTTGGWVLTAPAVVDGVVYAASDDHNLYALNAEKGELLWSHTTGDVIRSTPTVVDGRVFFGSNDNHVYALDAATGTELWKYDTGDWVQHSPAVSGGKVYFGAPSDGDRKVHAVNGATGEVAWVADHPFPTGAEHTPTPLGDKVYAPGAEYGQFFALDAATGEVVWQAEVGGYVQSAPAMLDGVVYLTVANRAYAMDAATGEIMWHVNTDQFPARDFPALVVDGIYYLAPSNNVYALDAATGEELWSYESYMLSTAPVIAGGVLYGASQAAEYVFALDAATSEEIWTQPIEDFNAYSLTVADGILYGQLDEGHLFAADTQDGLQVWEFKAGGYADIRVYTITEGVVYSAGPNNSVYAHRAPQG